MISPSNWPALSKQRISTSAFFFSKDRDLPSSQEEISKSKEQILSKKKIFLGKKLDESISTKNPSEKTNVGSTVFVKSRLFSSGVKSVNFPLLQSKGYK